MFEYNMNNTDLDLCFEFQNYLFEYYEEGMDYQAIIGYGDDVMNYLRIADWVVEKDETIQEFLEMEGIIRVQ